MRKGRATGLVQASVGNGKEGISVNVKNWFYRRKLRFLGKNRTKTRERVKIHRDESGMGGTHNIQELGSGAGPCTENFSATRVGRQKAREPQHSQEKRMNTPHGPNRGFHKGNTQKKTSKGQPSRKRDWKTNPTHGERFWEE